jgi:hypothetical protein
MQTFVGGHIYYTAETDLYFSIARDKIATSQYLMSIVTMVFLGVVASCGVGDTPRVI